MVGVFKGDSPRPRDHRQEDPARRRVTFEAGVCKEVPPPANPYPATRGRLIPSSIPAECGRVRYGAYVPVLETLSWAADPLLETQSIDVLANQAQPVWLTLELPRDAAPGIYHGTVRVGCRTRQQIAEFTLRVEVLPAVLPEPTDWTFFLNMWQDPTPIATAHGVEIWSEEHWRLLERYAENLAAHGLK